MNKLFAIVGLPLALLGCGKASLDASAIEACDNASDFVQRRLRAAGGSTVGPCAQDSELLKVERLGEEPQKYRVSNYVDARRGFGPPVRQTFVAELERVDGGWKLSDLKMGTPP